MRKTKRELIAAEASGDEDYFLAKSVLLRRQREEYAKFSKAAGLLTQNERTRVYGFSRSEASKASWAARKALDKSEKGGIIGVGSGKMYISSVESPIEQKHTGKGNPNAILMFDTTLNKRQQKLLDALPEFDSRVTISKKSVNMADLSALTAMTGDEFAMFTKGNERLIIRGNYKKVNIDPEQADLLSRNGYKWSGHTHPGTDFLCMQPSDGDYSVLDRFKQSFSVVYNSKGDFRTFEKRR